MPKRKISKEEIAEISNLEKMSDPNKTYFEKAKNRIVENSILTATVCCLIPLSILNYSIKYFSKDKNSGK